MAFAAEAAGYDYLLAPRGAGASAELRLENSEPVDVVFDLEPTGDIADWIRLTDADDRSVEVSSVVVGIARSRSVRVELAVPSDVPNGDYTGTILIQARAADSEASEGAAADVGVGVSVPVGIEVGGTEQRVSSIADATVGRAEVGSPQRFVARVANEGNVLVDPEMTVRITRDGQPITELSTLNDYFPVDASQSGNVHADWDTSGERAGDYVATFSVQDRAGPDSVPIGQAEVAFTLDPLGTFSRSGELIGLTLITDPSTGGPAQVEAIFQNTDEIESEIILAGSISRDGVLVTTFDTVSRRVSPGATVPMIETFSDLEAGDYEVTGHINYDGLETSSRSVSFSIDATTGEVVASGDAAGSSGGSDGGGGRNGTLTLVGLAVVALAGGAIFFWMRAPKATGSHAAYGSLGSRPGPAVASLT